MALIQCKECGKEISSAAAACPHCGKPNAAKPPTPAALGCLVVIVVIGLFAVLSRCSTHDDSKTDVTPAPDASPQADTSATTVPDEAASAVEDDTAILNDVEALDKKFGTEAMLRCASEADDYLRSVSKYAFKWDDMGFLEFKFDHYRKVISSPGVLTAISNKVSMQNGFGAFERVELYCNYDTQAKKVVEYSIDSPPYHPAATPPPPSESVPSSAQAADNATSAPVALTIEPTESPGTPVSAPVSDNDLPAPRTLASTADDLSPVRAIDSQAADHVANSCRHDAGGDTQRETLCRAREMAAWKRLVPGHEFPNITQATIDKCKQPPFPDTFVAREACAKYEMSDGAQP